MGRTFMGLGAGYAVAWFTKNTAMVTIITVRFGDIMVVRCCKINEECAWSVCRMVRVEEEKVLTISTVTGDYLCDKFKAADTAIACLCLMKSHEQGFLGNARAKLRSRDRNFAMPAHL
jgi:hypothetical protein